MVHLSENSIRLNIKEFSVRDYSTIITNVTNFNDVVILRLPHNKTNKSNDRLKNISNIVEGVSDVLGICATLIVIGEVLDLVSVHYSLNHKMRYQHWIAIKKSSINKYDSLTKLPEFHFGALIYTKYKSPLRHSKTRIAYSYCPACDKTTKDYGGKKHTYHEYGTLMSDVWRDIHCDLDKNITPIIERFADLFGISPYKELRIFDLNELNLKRKKVEPSDSIITDLGGNLKYSNLYPNRLIHGDCIEALSDIPSNSVDFIFTDPPYNLGKKYVDYSDGLEIEKYFEWCDSWINQLARIIKQGKTIAILNIPLWSIRHFAYMEKILYFQNWIVWDALSFPVRFIMPSHYTILCFSKGEPRKLPGLIRNSNEDNASFGMESFNTLLPMGEVFCLRSKCIKNRKMIGINDRGPLTDICWDIHRLKHNTRRVDHPCQLPPHLMYRLISIFTEPNEIVLDCFNGSGTTTLAAHQIGRRYIAIEKADIYHNMATKRHQEIERGLDPFRKATRTLNSKNSPVPRMPKRKYEVSKKALQLEVKRIANDIGRIPSRDEVMKYSEYPITYFDDYFASWGEVCAAARTTGMSEYPRERKKRRNINQYDLL